MLLLIDQHNLTKDIIKTMDTCKVPLFLMLGVLKEFFYFFIPLISRGLPQWMFFYNFVALRPTLDLCQEANLTSTTTTFYCAIFGKIIRSLATWLRSLSPPARPLVVYKNALNDSVTLSKKILKSSKAIFHLV